MKISKRYTHGRAFIPDVDGNGKPVPKGFLDSHWIDNYGWIFTRPKHTPNDNGYVIPR